MPRRSTLAVARRASLRRARGAPRRAPGHAARSATIIGSARPIGVVVSIAINHSTSARRSAACRRCRAAVVAVERERARGRDHEVDLARVAPVDRGLPDVRARGDAFDGEPVETTLGEEVDGGFEDRLVGLGAARAARAARFGSAVVVTSGLRTRTGSGAGWRATDRSTPASEPARGRSPRSRRARRPASPRPRGEHGRAATGRR